MMFKKKSNDDYDAERDDMEKPTIGETLRIQDITNFFKEDINPSYIDGIIEEEIAMVKKDLRGLPKDIILLIAIIMIAGMVAYVGISGVNNNNACQQQLMACHGVSSGTPTSNPGGIVGAIQSNTPGSQAASIT